MNAAAIVVPRATRERRVWLRVGTLLDGTSTAPAHDANVVYDASAIRFVGHAGRTPHREWLRPGQDQPDLDASDCTLLPGLIEAHAHLFLEGGKLDPAQRAAHLQRPPGELLAAAHDRLAKLVRLGMAAVRDAGDKDGVGLALSKLYASGSRPLMPYLDSPGAAIHHAGSYGGFMAGALEQYPSPHACVATRVAAGADRIKLIATGIINLKRGAVTSEPPMTTDEIAQLVAAAKSFGRQTFAHASGDTGIDRAIAGGVDTIEHGFFVRDDQLALMRDRRIGWVPTFAPVQKQIEHAALMGWDPNVVSNLRRILEQHAASLVRAHAMGVLVIAGSDAGSCGVAHGLGLLDELEFMEHAGLSPIAVINSATGLSATRLGFREDFGRIAPGCLSRFILTRHSPLETVSNLRKPRFVIFDGETYETGEDHNEAGL